MMRTLELDRLKLLSGGHSKNDDYAMCVMEAVAFVAGEGWSDHPKCASPVLGEFLRSWNDAMNEEDRQQLKPYITKLVGTAGTKEQEDQRAWMALDWLCHVSAPTWLRLAGLVPEAEAIEATAPINDSASATAAQGALQRGREAPCAARAAAWAAAGAATWAAAGAATWAAAGAATWAATRAATWAAAGATARAAAGDAAWAAAWAALRPTVVALQASALELLDRMIAVTA